MVIDFRLDFNNSECIVKTVALLSFKLFVVKVSACMLGFWWLSLFRGIFLPRKNRRNSRRTQYSTASESPLEISLTEVSGANPGVLSNLKIATIIPSNCSNSRC